MSQKEKQIEVTIPLRFICPLYIYKYILTISLSGFFSSCLHQQSLIPPRRQLPIQKQRRIWPQLFRWFCTLSLWMRPCFLRLAGFQAQDFGIDVFARIARGSGAFDTGVWTHCDMNWNARVWVGDLSNFELCAFSMIVAMTFQDLC
jgi:hypothetical protein